MRLPASAIALSFAAFAGETWITATFEAFSRGKTDGAGNNLYVSRDGTLRTINRFDLNRDGFIDLVFNSTHDYSYLLPAVAVSRRGHVDLPVEGSRQVWTGDLNRDGFPDAVFCPNDSGLQSPRRYLKIAWGAASGLHPSRVSGVLPVYGARAAAAADLNADGWPDIVTLNQPAWAPGQPAGNIVRVYWGSPAGFRPSNFKDFGVPDGVDLAATHNEVAVLSPDSVRVISAAGMHAAIRLGAGNARSIAAAGSRYVIASAARVLAVSANPPAVTELDSSGANHVAAAGEMVVLTGEAGVRILGGSKIPIANATAAAILDFDGDARNDIAISILHDGSRMETESVIYLAKAGGRYERGAAVRTSGAAHVASMGSTAIFANSLGGTVAEKVPVYVYWGGADGFQPSRRLEIPLQSGYESSAADLDGDGWPDLIVLNSGHVGEAAAGEPTLGANILWGSRNGFDWNRRTVLAEGDIGSSAVADLDRDGYLDIVLGAFDSAAEKDRLVIYWGSAAGYTKSRRTPLARSGRAVSISLADLDADGWLDIAAVDSTRDRVVIFPGSATGFDPQRMRTIGVPFAISLESADLNGDGRLDLVVGSYQDRESGAHDGGTYLFWGDDKGFRQSNSQWLPGFAPVGPAVADFDGDGHLDLFTPHYLGNGTREQVPSYLYWGSKEGFSPRRRTALVTDSAHDALAADFDRDGRLDLAVSCHTTDGDHKAASMIFFNDGRRFENPRKQTLPTIGPHWMWDQDMGHIANRSWRQTYESEVRELERAAAKVTANVEAETRHGSQVVIEIRSAATRERLAAAEWKPAGSAAARFLQYRLTLVSANGDAYPEVRKVTLIAD
jgi:hypothetical protein